MLKVGGRGKSSPFLWAAPPKKAEHLTKAAAAVTFGRDALGWAPGAEIAKRMGEEEEERGIFRGFFSSPQSDVNIDVQFVHVMLHHQ